MIIVDTSSPPAIFGVSLEGTNPYRVRFPYELPGGSLKIRGASLVQAPDGVDDQAPKWGPKAFNDAILSALPRHPRVPVCNEPDGRRRRIDYFLQVTVGLAIPTNLLGRALVYLDYLVDLCLALELSENDIFKLVLQKGFTAPEINTALQSKANGIIHEGGVIGRRLDDEERVREERKEAAKKALKEAEVRARTPQPVRLFDLGLIAIMADPREVRFDGEHPLAFLKLWPEPPPAPIYLAEGHCYLLKHQPGPYGVYRRLAHPERRLGPGIKLLSSDATLALTPGQQLPSITVSELIIKAIFDARASTIDRCELPEDTRYDLASPAGIERARQFRELVQQTRELIIGSNSWTYDLRLRRLTVDSGIRGFLLTDQVVLDIIWAELQTEWARTHEPPIQPKHFARAPIAPYRGWQPEEIALEIERSAKGHDVLLSPDELYVKPPPKPVETKPPEEAVPEASPVAPAMAAGGDYLSVLATACHSLDKIRSETLWAALERAGHRPSRKLNNRDHDQLSKAMKRLGWSRGHVWEQPPGAHKPRSIRYFLREGR